MRYILFLFFLLFQSCQPTTSTPTKTVEQPFFDLKSYFEKEKTRLGGLSNFSKTTVVNGQEETKQLATLNFDNELRIFMEADINRPAWFDKYEIDSIFQAGNLTKINYTTKEKALEVQRVMIDYNQAEVTKIRIEKTAETALADTQFNLVYEPKIGYTIENKQQLTVGEDKAFLVMVEF